MRKTKPIEERFWTKVSKTDCCWNWIGSRQGNGYGYLHFGSKSVRHPYRAHRLSWEIHNGPIPDGLWVLHKCDNRLCVNPAHLFLGDRRDNMIDCANKGRVRTIGKRNMTHCVNGHGFTEENTRTDVNGHRRCRACAKQTSKRSWARNSGVFNARRRAQYSEAKAAFDRARGTP